MELQKLARAAQDLPVDVSEVSKTRAFCKILKGAASLLMSLFCTSCNSLLYLFRTFSSRALSAALGVIGGSRNFARRSVTGRSPVAVAGPPRPHEEGDVVNDTLPGLPRAGSSSCRRCEELSSWSRASPRTGSTPCPLLPAEMDMCMSSTCPKDERDRRSPATAVPTRSISEPPGHAEESRPLAPSMSLSIDMAVCERFVRPVLSRDSRFAIFRFFGPGPMALADFYKPPT